MIGNEDFTKRIVRTLTNEFYNENRNTYKTRFDCSEKISCFTKRILTPKMGQEDRYHVPVLYQDHILKDKLKWHSF